MTGPVHPTEALEAADQALSEAIDELDSWEDGAPESWRTAREMIAAALQHRCLDVVT